LSEIKIKKYILLTMLLLQLLILKVAAQENYEIRQVNFRGNKTLEKSFLLEKMAVDEISYLEKVLTKNEPTLYSQKLMDLDLERLKKIYQSEGFVDMNVMLKPPSVNNEKQTVKLNFEITEGNPFNVDTVQFKLENQHKKVNIDSIAKRKKFVLKKGVRFSDEALAEDMELVENIFRDLGYAFVSVNYTIDLKPEQHKVDITYSISPGQVCTFGETKVTGNSKVSEEFIRKQIGYKNGEQYNKSLLTKTRKALYHLQLFRVVSILPVKDSVTENNSIPVRLFVEEAKMFTTEYGIGYGTEDKFRTYIDLTYIGFLGAARRLNFYAKHSALEPYYFSLKWTQPQLFNKKGSVSINPFIGNNSEPGYDTRTYGINIPASYDFNKHLNSTLTYYFEDVEQTIEEDDPEFPDPEDDKFPYKKSGILAGTVFSTENPKFSPNKGVNVSLGAKMNGYFFGGDYSYIRLWSDFRTYQKAGDLVMAFRLMAGGIHSSDESNFIPVEDRFYSGGSNSIRGWSRSQLGPKRESGSPLGGKSIFESNIELRYPLFWRLGGVAFFEAGNVWEEEFKYKLNDLGYAAGAGLRLETPIGPVRFDVGLPLWNEKKSPQFFISVGQAF